jgi:hypothetical protein
MRLKKTAVALTAILMGGCTHTQGMVAFFNTDACPRGWSDVPSAWQGRYAVMTGDGQGQMVGQALAPGENRVTGDHGHSVGSAITAPRESRDNNSALWGDNGYVERPLNAGSAVPRNAGETVRPGTNAPYVRLRACERR